MKSSFTTINHKFQNDPDCLTTCELSKFNFGTFVLNSLIKIDTKEKKFLIIQIKKDFKNNNKKVKKIVYK